MQVNQPQSGNAEATTPRYDTIVIRGAQGNAVPKEVDGGEVTSWSRGHELAAMDALEEFVEDLAAGDCSYPTVIAVRAQNALNLMTLRRLHGWDADAVNAIEQQESDRKAGVDELIKVLNPYVGACLTISQSAEALYDAGYRKQMAKL
ncbi:hypothetical protein [Pseudomonas mucidolens]|uniref:Uncharacterized protein n=1 Tax=Pseudomonas mucidolens TaxID=46679 RepID=A0A1H2M5N8_9PSED|nr:hypothetical protein [Pseudomonas mucidolens]SDU87806.1 hypothetical protein SAMN05216202_0968 [Pseudomonas mucidolens]SQH34611.1 Uncharacterised protein [Pseudomonas mucidolens]